MTEAQLVANRANAQFSTGPRTEKGKRRSSLNAFRYGLTGQIVIHTSRRPASLPKSTVTTSAGLSLPLALSKPRSPSPSPRTTGASTAPAPSKTPSSPSAFRRISAPTTTSSLTPKSRRLSP